LGGALLLCWQSHTSHTTRHTTPTANSPCSESFLASSPLVATVHLILELTMHTSEYDYLFKLLLIGDSGVGKVRGYCGD
jgi:hypothetical protein